MAIGHPHLMVKLMNVINPATEEVLGKASKASSDRC